MRYKLEKIFTILALFLLTGAILPIVFGRGGEGGSIETQLIFLFIYLISAIFAFPYRNKILYLIFKEKSVILLAFFAVSSIFWSGSWYSTVRSSFALFMSILLGSYISVRFTISEQVKIISWVYIISSVLSLIACLLFPHIATHSSGPHEGFWRGIYIHKNGFGRLLGLGITVLFLLTFERRVKPIKRPFLFLLLLIFLLLKAGSITPLLATTVTIGLLTFYNIFKLPVKYMLLISTVYLTLMVVGLFFITVNAESILALFGRDLTLTGRGELWTVLYEKIQARPFLGYGFQGFWRGWNGESGDVWSVLNWRPNQGHNGFIDLTLHLGAMGLILFMLGFIRAFLRAVVLISTEQTMLSLFPVLYLTYYFIANMAESSLLRQNSFFWIVYVAICFSLESRSLNQQFEKYIRSQPKPTIKNVALQ